MGCCELNYISTGGEREREITAGKTPFLSGEREGFMPVEIHFCRERGREVAVGRAPFLQW